jgi:hypothetical protein
VLGFARLVLLGADNHRLHEEIIAAGGYIVNGKLERMNQGEIERTLAGATDAEVPAAFRQRLCELWPGLEKSARAALEARQRDLVKSLEKKMSDTCFAEIDKMKAILTELAQGIERSLSEKPPPQMELFSEQESRQFESDREALRHRLSEIPAEIDAETERIMKRYAEPKAFLFPFALCFYVPEGLAASGGRS